MCTEDIFVRLSLRNVGEIRNLIVGNPELAKESNEGRYLMCAGKYDKNGWTIVFKAKNYKEAEYIIDNTPFNDVNIYSKKRFSQGLRILC